MWRPVLSLSFLVNLFLRSFWTSGCNLKTKSSTEKIISSSINNKKKLRGIFFFWKSKITDLSTESSRSSQTPDSGKCQNYFVWLWQMNFDLQNRWFFHWASRCKVKLFLHRMVCAGGIRVFCWRPQSPWLPPRVLLSLQSPRLSQQSLQMDWRTCGQTWPPSLFCSHGTESRPGEFPGNAFFQLTCSVFNFWLNPRSGFPPVFLFSFSFFFHVGWFCFHGIGPTLLEMPGAFGICWNHLRPPLFLKKFCSWLVQPCLSRWDVWLTCGSSSVLCVTFSSCMSTRRDRLVHLFVLMQLLDNTPSPGNIRNMCPSENPYCFFLFFSSFKCVCSSSWNGIVGLSAPSVEQNSCTSANAGWTPMKSVTDVHGPLRMNPNEFGVLPTFPWDSPVSVFEVSSELSW